MVPRMTMTESVRLEEVARDSTRLTLTGVGTTDYSFKVFERHFCGESCLELGPAEGVMTKHLAKRFRKLTLVEGSESFAALLRAEHPTAIIHHRLIEDFSPTETYDN